MRRPGHHRPIGSLTAWWRFLPFEDRPPELGDVFTETTGPNSDPDELERAYLLVGLEETSSKRFPWRLRFERLAWDPSAWPGDEMRSFFTVPRST